MTRIFILGAGFSRSVNHSMPLLTDLTDKVKSELQFRNVEIGDDLDTLGDVERWLSLLADPAPWLSSAAQIRNTALFSTISGILHSIIVNSQLLAASNPAPDWLISLARHWIEAKATVITFNYDGLVELAYLEAAPQSATLHPCDVFAIPVTPASARLGHPGYARNDSFSLLKLHGSFDWWYSGLNAQASDQIYWLDWHGTFGESLKSLSDPSILLPDKSPMMIPPVAAKSSFYENSLLAAQWVKAARALRNADELVLMGYSAPATDLTVTTLISTQFKGSTIVPVNPDSAVLGRVRDLIGHRQGAVNVVEDFIDPSALRKWTTAHT